MVSEKEELSEKERYHDYLITSLRTCEGADLNLILELFGESVRNDFTGKCDHFIKEGLMFEQGSRVAIEPDSWLLADHIMRELFLE